MANFFGFNCEYFMDMNNLFMSNWSFPNYFTSFQMPYFNIFDSMFNSYNLSYNPFIPQVQSPSLFSSNYDYFANTTKTKTDKPTAVSMSAKANTDTFTRSSNINYAKDDLKLSDYNASKGERLANIALKNRSKKGFTKRCAKYVKYDIFEAGLGSYIPGHAYQMRNIMKNNKNFKEISPESVNVNELPAGCVLVYDKGVEGYNKKYGHTEITTGDGRAVSDGVTKNLYKKPSSIFIPV